MKPVDEVVSPTADESPPLPRSVVESGPAPSPPAPPLPPLTGPPVPSRPTPELILHWVAAADGNPWFPSAHARQAGIPRDSLDEPLAELRFTGLVRVADWVRGAGQGYVLTEDGAAVVRGATPGRADAPGPARDEPAGSTEAGGLPGSMIDLRPPLITPAVLLANMIWFFVGLVIAVRLGVPLGGYLVHGDPAVQMRLGAVSAPDLLRGEWWRLVTCCFVHIGLLHLVANLFGLGTAGPLAELLWGRGRVFVIYAVSGLAGSCLAMAVGPVSGPTGAVVQLAGASGAIWGVLTSLLAWLLLFRDTLPPRLATEWFRRLGLALALNAGVSLLPGVSLEAHLGGGLAGFAAAGLLNVMRSGRWPRRVAAGVLLTLLPAVCLGGLVWAMRSGENWAVLRHPHTIWHGLARSGPGDPRRAAELVNLLRPKNVRKVEQEAGFFLMLTPARRTPARTAEIRGQVARLHAAADEIQALTTGAPAAEPGPALVRAFAGARGRSLGLLLALIDAKTIPDATAWKAWGASRREADQLAGEIGLK